MRPPPWSAKEAFSTARKPSPSVGRADNKFENHPAQSQPDTEQEQRDDLMRGEAGLEADVLENVRRYRAIASLCRQTAAFRPEQRMSLLRQAEEWERLAANELELACEAEESSDQDLALQVLQEIELQDIELQDVELQDNDLSTEPQVDTRWWLPRREGLFAGLAA
jgi:hypothetical protein